MCSGKSERVWNDGAGSSTVAESQDCYGDMDVAMPALAVLLIDFLGVLRTLAMCPISFTI